MDLSTTSWQRVRRAWMATVVATAGGLAACGGGSGGSPAVALPAPTPPPPSAPGSPAATLTAPVALADNLAGPVTLAATASDDVGVAAVEFQVDGVTVGEDATDPYALVVDTAAFADGQHVVRARARDGQGNVSPWSAATVRSANGSNVTAGFASRTFATGFGVAPAFAQTPDGRFLVCEQGGRLRVVSANGVLLATPFHTFTVDSRGERGLLGVAIDPDFASNGFVYVYYTATTPTVHNRIARIVAAAPGSNVSSGAETTVLDLPALSNAQNHNGGALHFGVDGKLYAAVGENADRDKAQITADPFGKMLRVNPDPANPIPADNPFCGTPGVVACAVWATGLRNPFTFAIQPVTGRMHINDVGEGTWEEISVGQAGANYGWPIVEGPQVPPAGSSITSPIFAYRHAATNPPGSGPGGFFVGPVITGGTFYPTSGPFPAAYHGNYFFADITAGFVARMDLANDNAVSAFANVGAPVDMLVGGDGALYVLSFGGAILRIAPP